MHHISAPSLPQHAARMQRERTLRGARRSRPRSRDRKRFGCARSAPPGSPAPSRPPIRRRRPRSASFFCGAAAFSPVTGAATTARSGFPRADPTPAKTAHASTIPVNPAARFWVATAIEAINIPACTNSPDTLSDRRPRSSRPSLPSHHPQRCQHQEHREARTVARMRTRQTRGHPPPPSTARAARSRAAPPIPPLNDDRSVSPVVAVLLPTTGCTTPSMLRASENRLRFSACSHAGRPGIE